MLVELELALTENSARTGPALCVWADRRRCGHHDGTHGAAGFRKRPALYRLYPAGDGGRRLRRAAAGPCLDQCEYSGHRLCLPARSPGRQFGAVPGALPSRRPVHPLARRADAGRDQSAFSGHRKKRWTLTAASREFSALSPMRSALSMPGAASFTPIETWRPLRESRRRRWLAKRSGR